MGGGQPVATTTVSAHSHSCLPKGVPRRRCVSSAHLPDASQADGFPSDHISLFHLCAHLMKFHDHRCSMPTAVACAPLSSLPVFAGWIEVELDSPLYGCESPPAPCLLHSRLNLRSVLRLLRARVG